MRQKPKILIVDDNEKNIFALELTLEGIDAEFVGATSGNDALKAILNHEFALALLDVQMPIMNGYELAEYIRGEKKTENLPLIFLSAIFTDAQHAFKGYEAGAVDFITKPFDPMILRSKVNVFLELHRRTIELQERTARLEAVNNELESFAHRVSHELKNDILVVKRIIELAEMSPNLVAETSSMISERMDKLSLFVERMLQLSRSGQVISEKQNLALSPLVREALERICPPEIQCELIISEPCDDIRGDLHAIDEIFSNLMGNAVKYRDPDKEKLVITVESRRRNGVAEILFTDNGLGIPRANLPKVFDAIFTTNEKEGFGFGLAIVKRITEAHGGRIRAESEGAGRGATFVITLPE